MAALLGSLDRPIEELCAQATAEAGLVVPANYNCPGQLVVSGEVAGVDRLIELAKAAGVKRGVRLQVSGAFHSPLMAPARDGLAVALDAARALDPAFPIVANVSAQPVATADAARRLLLEQLVSPVRWTEVVETLAARHPDALYVEMGPGSVLSGLVRKIAPSVQTLACGTARDVEALHERLAASAA